MRESRLPRRGGISPDQGGPQGLVDPRPGSSFSHVRCKLPAAISLRDFVFPHPRNSTASTICRQRLLCFCGAGEINVRKSQRSSPQAQLPSQRPPSLASLQPQLALQHSIPLLDIFWACRTTCSLAKTFFRDPWRGAFTSSHAQGLAFSAGDGRFICRQSVSKGGVFATHLPTK